MWKAASLRSRSKANRKTGKARPLRRAFSFEPLSSPGPEQGRPHDERACRRSRGSPANAPAILRGARPGPRPAVVLAPPCAWRGLAATSRRGVALGAELAWPSPENRDSRHRPTRPPIPLVSLLKRALGRRFFMRDATRWKISQARGKVQKAEVFASICVHCFAGSYIAVQNQ